jgi:hypothetical protein
MLIRGLLSAFAMLLVSTSLDAQNPPASVPKPVGSILFSPGTVSSYQSSADTSAAAFPTTQWRRGLLVGGTIGAVGLGASFFSLCHSLRETKESCLGSGVAGAAFGALVGGTVGALIGGQAHRRTDAMATDSIRANSAAHNR